MNAAPNNPSGEIIQLGMFDSIMGLLSVNFIFLIGSLVVIAVLAVILKKDHTIPKMKTSVLSMLFYFYLCVLFSSIVGTPSLGEFMRLSQLGEKFSIPT